MKLYSGPLSLFSRKVEIALTEKRQNYERVMVPFNQDVGYSPKHPDVLAINPKAQIPILVDGDVRLFDSTLIIEYLEDAYPEPPLFPAGTDAKAKCRLIELSADEILFPMVVRLMYRTEPANPDPQRQKRIEAEGVVAERDINEYYAELNSDLQGTAFFCAEFSAADIAVFMAILFANRLDGPTIKNYPALASWFKRIGSRPSVVKVAEEVAAADRELSLN